MGLPWASYYYLDTEEVDTEVEGPGGKVVDMCALEETTACYS